MDMKRNQVHNLFKVPNPLAKSGLVARFIDNSVKNILRNPNDLLTVFVFAYTKWYIDDFKNTHNSEKSYYVPGIQPNTNELLLLNFYRV